MKLTKEQLKTLIKEEKQKLLSEDYARGIPDFALSQVASESVESLKRHLKRHINQMSKDPVKQRQMLNAANNVLDELEIELKEKMEDKLLKFLRMI